MIQANIYSAHTCTRHKRVCLICIILLSPPESDIITIAIITAILQPGRLRGIKFIFIFSEDSTVEQEPEPMSVSSLR